MCDLLEGDEFNHQLLKRADYAGNTALHLAAVGPEPAVLRTLLTRGASVHVRNRANNSPLYLAEKMGNAECVRLLKEAGGHLWLDNELKGEGSRVPSRGASRGVSPERGGKGEGEPRPGSGSGEIAPAPAQVEKEKEKAGDGVGAVGVGAGAGEDLLAHVEPARVLLTGDKGKIVG